MAKRYFNWKLAFVLVVAMVVFAAAALALHNWQQNTRAEQALPLGEQAYEQGDWQEAARQLGRYLAVDGSNVPILLKYADAQLKIRPLESAGIQQAIAAYSAALRLDGSNATAARQLVEIYLSMRTPGEAELKARQYLEDQDDATIRRFLGMALIQQRKWLEAGRVLTELVQEHPDQIPAYEVMGRLAQTRPGDVNEPGAYWFDKAVEQNPDSALAYIIRGAFRRQTGDRLGAMADLEQAETLDLTDTEVHLRLAGELISAEAIDKAREHLKRIQTVAPAEHRLWEYWAEVAIRSRSDEEMKTVAEAGLEKLGTQPWDFMPIAVELLIRTGQHDQAKDCIVQMKEKNIQPARGAFLEGLLAEQQGQLREAVACWERAIGLGYQLSQDDRWGRKPPFVRVVLASAFLKMGDTQSAIGQLRTLVSQMPTYAGGYLLLARLEAQAGDWEAVTQHARQLGQLVPGNKEATTLELQARIRQLASADGPVADREARWRDVDARLAQLESSETDEAAAVQIRLLQAESATLQKNYEQAGVVLEELLKNHPEERRAVLLRAQVYVAEGKIEEAAALLRQTVEQFPESIEAVTKLALLYNGQEKRSECEAAIRDALTRMEEPRARRLLGLFLADFYASWGQDDRLYEHLTDMAGQFPEDITIKRRLLSLGRVSSDEKVAQKIVDEIKALEGQKGWQWRIEQTRVWIRSDNLGTHYTEAVRLLQENLLANPEDQTSRMLLGAAHEKAGEMRLALASYRDTLNRSRAPDNLQIMLVLGAAYEKTGDLEEALAIYKEAMKQSPNDMLVIGRMVDALYKTKEFDEARRILDEAAQRDLRHMDLQRLRLAGDLQRGALSSASDILQEMVHQDPNDTSAQFTLALLRARQKRFDEAQAILTDLRTKNPDAVRITEAQVQVYILQGREEDAIRLCNELVERSGNVVAHTLRARTYATLGQHDQALSDFDRAVSLESDKPGVWLTRANFYRDRGRTADEVKDVQKALDLAPDDLGIQRRALQLFLASGDRDLFHRAEAILQQAIETRPENIELRVLKARVLLSRETAPAIQEARLLLSQIVADRPAQIDAWELLGRLELRRGRSGNALDMALRGLAHNADARPLLLLKADAEAQRSPTLAVPTLRELLRQDPNDLVVIARLVDADAKSGSPDKTEELLQMLQDRLAVLKGPDHRQCEMLLATTLYRSGQASEAEARFESLLKADPNDPTPLLTLARLPGSLQRCSRLRPMIDDWVTRHPSDVQTPTAMAGAWIAARDEAGMRFGETLLRSVLERVPESVGTLLVLADLVGATGRSEENAKLNRRILDIDPNNMIAMNNLAWFLCEEKSQYQEALTLANRGLERTPEYLDLIDTRGVIHYRMGNREDAVKDFGRFIDLCPPSTQSLVITRFHLARVYLEEGNLMEAARQLDQIPGLEDGTSGLSAADQAEAKLLLDRVKKGS